MYLGPSETFHCESGCFLLEERGVARSGIARPKCAKLWILSQRVSIGTRGFSCFSIDGMGDQKRYYHKNQETSFTFVERRRASPLSTEMALIIYFLFSHPFSPFLDAFLEPSSSPPNSSSLSASPSPGS